MRRDLKDIAGEALELSVTARAELASQLLKSLADLSEEENEQLWAREAECRYAEYKAGNIEAVPAEEVFARLRLSNFSKVAMPQDPIVGEIHGIREQLLELYGGSDGYMKHIEELEEELKDRIVSREPRPPVAPGRKVLREIIHSDPDILGGIPVFIGTRVPVRILLDYLKGDEPLEEFLDNYPSVSRDQAVAFLEEAGRAALAQIA
jgi:putative addiction module component (TIGR02574 family)